METLSLSDVGLGFALLLDYSSLLLAGNSLLLEELGLAGLSLADVDSLDEDALVLEHVTLSLHVEVVVDVLVDLVSLSELPENATEDSLTTNPENLLGHTSLTGTLPLTRTHVTTLSLSEQVLSNASS